MKLLLQLSMLIPDLREKDEEINATDRTDRYYDSLI